MVKISNTEAQHLVGMIQEWKNIEIQDDAGQLISQVLLADRIFGVVEFLLETHEDAD